MRPLLAALLTLFLTFLAPAQEPIREHIEWLDVWVTAAEKDDSPRVLLIGDSITRGYFGDVEKRLEGKAYCARLTTSKCVAAPSFLDEVALVLKQYEFAVIHFNNGLHGWGYTEDQYRNGMLKFLEVVKKQAPDAKLIWATTTPVRERDNLQQVSERTERVRARNKIVAQIMDDHGIPTNDLFGLVIDHPEFHGSDGVHFNGKGRGVQGEAVAGIVLKTL
jgi:lysophospholipase L1-like esterase